MTSFQGRISSARDYLSNNWKVLFVKGSLVTILGFVGILIDKEVWPEAGKPMPDNSRAYLNDVRAHHHEVGQLLTDVMTTPDLLKSIHLNSGEIPQDYISQSQTLFVFIQLMLNRAFHAGSTAEFMFADINKMESFLHEYNAFPDLDRTLAQQKKRLDTQKEELDKTISQLSESMDSVKELVEMNETIIKAKEKVAQERENNQFKASPVNSNKGKYVVSVKYSSPPNPLMVFTQSESIIAEVEDVRKYYESLVIAYNEEVKNQQDKKTYLIIAMAFIALLVAVFKDVREYQMEVDTDMLNRFESKRDQLEQSGELAVAIGRDDQGQWAGILLRKNYQYADLVDQIRWAKVVNY
ncbi:hypothetical protein R1T43_19190 [Alteromonas sp. CI.11.F.A3]|uniref:hypothetical protein n=1 Tax=Alteromonas sp. CI.11.F.A3 TaxID=3079555 RepID=UPI002943B8AE|nr:hypothetical protein [Alteromonas sp. CI.11.F.A3]WOI37288.1 hypothetical protein R1T43_19190 [Alteromonas sp. CI.11.F.A3]